MKSVSFLLMAFLLFQPALGLEIVDIYSDPRSCDVTAEGTGKGDLLRVDLLPLESYCNPGPLPWIIRELGF